MKPIRKIAIIGATGMLGIPVTITLLAYGVNPDAAGSIRSSTARVGRAAA